MSENVSDDIKESYPIGTRITVQKPNDPEPWDGYVTGYHYLASPDGLTYKRGDGPAVQLSTNPPNRIVDKPKIPYTVEEEATGRAAMARLEDIIS
jgi:hypothetical protein